MAHGTDKFACDARHVESKESLEKFKEMNRYIGSFRFQQFVTHNALCPLCETTLGFEEVLSEGEEQKSVQLSKL